MLGSMLLVSNELSIHLGLGKGFETPTFSKYPESEKKSFLLIYSFPFWGSSGMQRWVWAGD